MNTLFLTTLGTLLLLRGGAASPSCRKTATSFQCQDLTELPTTGGRYVNRVDVSYGRITAIDTNFFRGFHNVRTFLAAHNNISKVESGAFGRVENLTMVDLSFNQLTTLQYDVFADNFLLEVVYLRGNPLTVPAGLPVLQSDSLRKLVADHTKINVFTETSFSLMRNVKYMSFEGNPVVKFSHGAINSLYNLEQLIFGKPADAECYQQSVFQSLQKIKERTDLTAEMCPSDTTSTTAGRKGHEEKGTSDATHSSTGSPNKSTEKNHISINEATAVNSSIFVILGIVIGILLLLSIVALCYIILSRKGYQLVINKDSKA